MIFFKRRFFKEKRTVETEYTATDYSAENISGGTSATGPKYAIGKPSSNSGNGPGMFSTNSGTTGYVTYTFGNVSIPTNATNVSISCSVKGGRENASQGKLEAQLLWIKTNGSISVGDKMTFSSTTSSVKTSSVSNETLFALANPRDATERDIALNIVLYVEVGYYGGHIDGITYTVSYDVYE